MKGYAVGWVSVSDKMYPAPKDEDTTMAIFINQSHAIEYAKQWGGLKVRPVEVSLRLKKRKAAKRE